MALDLSELNKNKKSVIKFSNKKERTLAPFETPVIEIGKKTVQESKAEREYHRLGKVEVKTNQLIDKAVKREMKHQLKVAESLAEREQVVTKSVASREQKLNTAPSRIDYLCLKKIPRKIIDFILSRANPEDDFLISVIDIADFRTHFSDMTDDHLRNAIKRLKDRGYFEEFNWSNNGMRVFKLKASIFK
jgi:hypothetical protein